MYNTIWPATRALFVLADSFKFQLSCKLQKWVLSFLPLVCPLGPDLWPHNTQIYKVRIIIFKLIRNLSFRKTIVLNSKTKRDRIFSIQPNWNRNGTYTGIVKTFKIGCCFFRNQKADDLKTWYAALGTPVISSLFKWWPSVDLHLFYDKVKFGKTLKL